MLVNQTIQMFNQFNYNYTRVTKNLQFKKGVGIDRIKYFGRNKLSPFTPCIEWKIEGGKLFQGGPNISENLAPGSPKISAKLKKFSRGPNILIYLDRWELKMI